MQVRGLSAWGLGYVQAGAGRGARCWWGVSGFEGVGYVHAVLAGLECPLPVRGLRVSV